MGVDIRSEQMEHLAGAILSPFPLKRATTAYRRLKSMINFLGSHVPRIIANIFCAPPLSLRRGYSFPKPRSKTGSMAALVMSA